MQTDKAVTLAVFPGLIYWSGLALRSDNAMMEKLKKFAARMDEIEMLRIEATDEFIGELKAVGKNGLST